MPQLFLRKTFDKDSNLAMYSFVRRKKYEKVSFFGSSVELVPGEHRPRRRRKRNLIIAVVAVLAVALIVGLAVGLTREDKEEGTSNKQSASDSQTTRPPITGDWLEQPCFSPTNLPECPWKGVKPFLLISLDGFFSEYLRRNITPIMDKLQHCGVHTKYMRPVYPSATTTNEHAIVTGLYPRYSGVVENQMYDSYLNKFFNSTLQDMKDPDWWGGETLWETAKKQGLKSASYFWQGGPVDESNFGPDIWIPYNRSVPYEDRVDTVLGWLTMDEDNRPDLITLYFEEPDSSGHTYGPDSLEVEEMIEKLDSTLQRLINGLYRNGLDGCVNMIFTADHGMTDTSCERQISLDYYMPEIDDMYMFSGTRGNIHGKFTLVNNSIVPNENVKTAEEIMSALECKNLHVDVFTNATIPVRLHYTHHRLGDVVMRVDGRWTARPKARTSCILGDHGYDNILESMGALFIAYGPAFKQNFQAEPFENVELYNLMTGLLNLEPAPNNGTAGTLSHILQEPPELPDNAGSYNLDDCRTRSASRTSNCNCDANPANNPSNINRNGDPFVFGTPVLEMDIPVCKLNGNQYTTFYSSYYKQPAVISLTLTSEQVQQYNTNTSSCIYADPRLTDQNNPHCSMYENTDKSIVHAQLVDPGLSFSSNNEETRLSSNMVPMYSGFRDGIWHYLWRLIKEYATTYNLIHVSTGSVFDRNYDSRADESTVDQMYVKPGSSILVPTHYFAIVMKCSQTVSSISQCQPGDLQTLAFVLPHLNKTTNCQPDKDYLKDNVVRLRDIEVLTGFRFLPDMDRLMAARKRTLLETELWPTPLLTPWVDLPCPIPDDIRCPAGKRPLLLISVDGFREDYLDRHLTPVIQRLAKCGVHTPYMRSVFPTVTFPNHYTIVTGLYPESHGIVANNMYDEDIDKIFSLSAPTAKDPRWWQGEPIWNTAMKQGLKTATYFWPGSDVNISGMYPNIYKPYDGKAGYTSRVIEVLDWLTMPVDERPDFLTLYFDEPDHAGHAAGPDSEQVNGQLETVDELMNMLMTTLYEKGLHNCVNIIILADHGMSKQSCSKKVMLEDFLPDVQDILVFDRTMANIFPEYKADNRSDAHRQNISQSVEDIVTNLTCKHSAMNVFTKADLPRRHHYINNPRIGDVMVKMKDEWIVLRGPTSWCTGGNHGWDNTYKSMHALFLAHGPAFKTNFTTEPFENIEVYNLMAEILNITAAPNNGTQGALSHILRSAIDVAVTQQTTASVCNGSTDLLPAVCRCDTPHNVSSNVYTSTGDGFYVFGIPTYAGNHCLLYQVGSSTAFSDGFNTPVWLTTAISNSSITSLMNSSFCIAQDNRVSYWDSTQCNNESGEPELMMSPLIGLLPAHPDNKHMASLSSTMIPMYSGFISGIWKQLKALIGDYVALYGEISVTSGPLFDYNNDGLRDEVTDITRFMFNNTAKPVPVPSHIFVKLVKCKIPGQNLPCDGGLDILSFILPHTNKILNCMSWKAYLKDNVARIRDIELMSGIQFMTLYNTTYGARLRTYLPEDLWQSILFRDWKDLPCPNTHKCNSDYRPLLLVSLDGFRADYLLRNITPTISKLSQCGVHAPYMRSVYPTKTFPNHYSIVTGLYPESHGIIDNHMYDLNLHERFSLGGATKLSPNWWGGEPIWLTAKKQGLKTATFFWPGSDVPIQGEYPDYWRLYDGKVTYFERVEQILSWMSLPKGERPDFLTLYFDEPDLDGHKYGPEGVNGALERVDDTISLLMEGLVQRDLHNCVNLVIIADHGMAGVSCDRLVRLSNYVDYDYLSANTWVWEGPFGRIANTYIYNKSSEYQISPAVDPASTEGIFSNLTCASPHLDMYRKASMPVRHHYSNNDRIDDIILDMDSDWLVTRSYAKTCKGGQHGYDNIEKSMHALFLAHGPAFKWNLTIDAFENIELYNMFTEILNVTAAPNNGTMGSLNHILLTPPPITDTSQYTDQINGTAQYDNQTVYMDYLQAVQCADICTNISSEMVSRLYDSAAIIEENGITDYPRLAENQNTSSTVTILHNKEYVLGYDESSAGTLWVKRRITNITKVKLKPVDCLIPDPRIQSYQGCVDQEDTQFGSLLLLADNPSQERHLSTLYAVMKPGFIQEIWTPFQELIEAWFRSYGDLEITTGPVFDHNHDSLPDKSNRIGEPSHFYSMITRCTDLDTYRCKKFQTFSVILPNSDGITNCKSFEEYIEDNECRIRDIEIITGLQFFTELSHDEAVRLRTYLPSGLWKSKE